MASSCKLADVRSTERTLIAAHVPPRLVGLRSSANAFAIAA